MRPHDRDLRGEARDAVRDRRSPSRRPTTGPRRPAKPAPSTVWRPPLKGGRRTSALAAATLAIMLAGCSTTGAKYVLVDSVAASGAAQLKDYYLMSELQRRDRVAGRELTSAYARNRDEKFVTLTHVALQAAGFRPVDSPDRAQLVILLNYGVDVAPGGLNPERTSTVQVVAFDWAAVRDMDQRNAVWRTNAYMEGSSGGLGRVVPILIQAAGPFLGTRTPGAVEVALP